MRSPNRRLLFVILLSVLFSSAFLCVSGCSRGSSSSSAGLSEEALLNKLPTDTFMFYVVNLGSDSYQKFLTSGWYSNYMKGLEDSFAKQPKASEFFKGYFDVLRTIGFMGDGKNPPLESGVFFIQQGKEIPVGSFGYFGTAKGGTDLSQTMAALKTSLSQHGVAPTDETLDGVAGFRLTAPEGTPSREEIMSGAATTQDPAKLMMAMWGGDGLYFFADNTKLSITSSKEAAAPLFKEGTETGFAQIQKSAAYTEAMKSLKRRKDEAYYAFMDLTPIISKIPASPGGPKPEEIPVSGLAISGSPTSATGVLPLTPKTDEQKRWLAALSGGGKHGTFGLIPAKPMAVLSVHGDVLQGLKTAALQEVPESQRAMVQQQVKMFDGVGSLTVAVYPKQTMMMVPEMMLAFEATNASELLAQIKALSAPLLAMAGPNGGTWGTKQVGDKQVDVLNNPMGIEVLVAVAGNGIVATNSESALVSALGAGSGSGTSFSSDVTSEMNQVVSGSNPAMAFYFDYSRLAGFMEPMMAAFAPQTGGQNPMDQLKNMGVIAMGFSLNNNVVSFDFAMEPPTA